MINISVIIPTYRPEFYLYECLHSICSQTLNNNNFEVIIILNGERDPYKSDIENFIKREMGYLSVSLLYTEQLGVSNARNLGLEHAKGLYICFIDDDDIISDYYLEGLLEKSNENGISVSNVYGFKENILRREQDYISIIYQKYKNRFSLSNFESRGFLSSSCCKLIPKKIIGNRKFNTNFVRGEDSLFMFLLSDKIRYIYIASPNVIYYRRLRVDSVSRSKINKIQWLINYYNLLSSYTRIYLKNPLNYNFLLFISRLVAPFKIFVK